MKQKDVRLSRTSDRRPAAIAGWLMLVVAFPLLGQSPPPAANQSESATPAAQPKRAAALDLIDQARADVAAAEAEHPVNTKKLVEALDTLVQRQTYARRITQETMELAQRAVSVAEAGAGHESLIYAEALAGLSQVYYCQDHPEQARPIAEQALEIAQRTGPGTLELALVADDLNTICFELNDKACCLRVEEAAVAAVRASHTADELYLASLLQNLGQNRLAAGDIAGARSAVDESIAICDRQTKTTPAMAVMESNAAEFHIRVNEPDAALSLMEKAREYTNSQYGSDSSQAGWVSFYLAEMYGRTGRLREALLECEKARALFIRWFGPVHSNTTEIERLYAFDLAAAGRLNEAVAMATKSHQALREHLSLAIRVLPERQALAMTENNADALDVALSILLVHPEIGTPEVYQEEIRSRALVTEEMAQRQASLNRTSDPEIAALLSALEKERTAVLAANDAHPDEPNAEQQRFEATSRMERIERNLAERSLAFRADQRTRSVALEDVRQHLPVNSVLVSFVAFYRRPVEAATTRARAPLWYMAFVLHPNSTAIRVFDLGEGDGINGLVSKVRAAADAEAHGGGLGSTRNERAYREAALALRKRIWDPLKAGLGDAKLALVVADGRLNLVPFSSLPDGKGYLVEHGPVIHMLTSERDLVPNDPAGEKHGLMAMGSPAFDHITVSTGPSTLRDAPIPCDAFKKVDFQPLPGSAIEVADIASTWRRNSLEHASLITGESATRDRFVDEASRNRVLHVATHAFLLDKSCGNGNPLLHSGLVFAGGQHGEQSSILTAQQIASLDLSGVDWAVLSACNTGNGELHDGEGVLGLQRAFRVAGAHSVIMTLWPVDDQVTRGFMHELYAQRLGRRATTADAVWNASRKLLLERRAAGKSTHPWYWAGFVGSGGWE